MSSSNLQKFCQALQQGESLAGISESCQECSHDDVANKWRKRFAVNLYKETGTWQFRKYDWHVFSYGYTDAISGSLAFEQYQKLHKTTGGYVFTHTVKNPLCCSMLRLPFHEAISDTLSRFPELADIYIVDRNFKWTFVMTHEQSVGIGPFFSRPGVRSPKPSR